MTPETARSAGTQVENDAPVIRVLIADDHALVREGLHLLIVREGDLVVVGEAADGAEAVAQALRLSPDVVVMDVIMPVKDGVEATREISGALPEVRVLALTGYDEPRLVARMLDAGASGFLMKGAPARLFVDAIRSVARGELVLPPEVAARALLHTSRTAPPSGVPRALLSDREAEVLREAARGLPNKEIARRLGVSVRTVHSHLGAVFAKLGASSRTEAVLLALRRGWVSLDDAGQGAESGKA